VRSHVAAGCRRPALKRHDQKADGPRRTERTAADARDGHRKRAAPAGQATFTVRSMSLCRAQCERSRRGRTRERSRSKGVAADAGGQQVPRASKTARRGPTRASAPVHGAAQRGAPGVLEIQVGKDDRHGAGNRTCIKSGPWLPRSGRPKEQRRHDHGYAPRSRRPPRKPEDRPCTRTRSIP